MIIFNEKIREMMLEFGFTESENIFIKDGYIIKLPDFLQVIDYLSIRIKLVECGYITENEFNKIFYFLKYD